MAPPIFRAEKDQVLESGDEMVKDDTKSVDFEIPDVFEKNKVPAEKSLTIEDKRNKIKNVLTFEFHSLFTFVAFF